MRDLLRDPPWKPDDLGHPIPDSPHACLVSLPTWDSVIGYEEGREDVVGKFRAGYPRFFLHPLVQQLNAELERRVAKPGERVVAYPSKAAVLRAKAFVEGRGGAARVAEVDGLFALVVPDSGYQNGRDYWRHAGEVVSSRQAEDFLEGRTDSGPESAVLRAAIATALTVAPEDCFIFESGMAAIFAIYRIVTAAAPGRKTLQLCFPYVDALKVQEHFGTGVDFVPLARGEQLAEAISAIRKGSYAAVFCEVPSNPLLNTVDLRMVSEACRASGTPLIVDDTVCSHLNLDVLPYADAITTSLTKWVSGIGDVMAGAVKLSLDSPHHESLRSALEVDVPGGSKLYGRDAEVLMANARGLTERVRIANAHSEPVAEFLAAHPAIRKVWYPKFTDREVYDALRHPTGGYGGLLSFTLIKPERTPEVYNAIRLSKGPSLGTEYSLVCPYTLLAHYEELEWAESCGVSRNLLRLSVGREDPGDLIRIFTDALAYA